MVIGYTCVISVQKIVVQLNYKEALNMAIYHIQCMYHSPSIENDPLVHRLTNMFGLNEEKILGLY